MAQLLFYEKERELFREAWDMKLSAKECKIVFEKLRRHYKLHSMRLIQTDRKKGGSVMHTFCGGFDIKVRYDTCFGILCHEVAHCIYYKKYKTFSHDKKLITIIKRVVGYCKRKNYWKPELEKRTTVIPKTIPSNTQIHQLKLEKRVQDLHRYEKKLAYYTKLYGNKIKKAKRSISALQRVKPEQEKTT